MVYKKHYEALIERCLNRELIENQYYEKHHIIPRCLGGVDDSNIVNLTPEEHYLAHLLLVKMYPDESKLWFSCLMMCNGLARKNNKLYGWVRKNCMKHLSNTTKDRWARKYGFDDYFQQSNSIWNLYINDKQSTKFIMDKFGMSEQNVLNSINFHAKTNDLVKILKLYRKEQKKENGKKSKANFTEEQEKKRIHATKTFDYTERNKLMSESRIGEGNPMYGKKFKAKIIQCPICHKEGGISQMKRWHFENCKRKIDEN
ncbi:MAG: HNH endonuclease signature motif containing protein [Bacteroidales bacterium]|jgi:hypothetical protein